MPQSQSTARPIFLIGFMGCGKSTLGHAVSKLSGCSFIDLDDYIEKLSGSSISDIFSKEGEESFRQLESDCLRRLTQQFNNQRVVIACGGGTPCFADNMALMNSVGATVLLEASLTTIVRRLKEEPHKRPKISGLNDTELAAYVGDTIKERQPFYAAAKYRFNSERLETEEEIIETANKFISEFIVEPALNATSTTPYDND